MFLHFFHSLHNAVTQTGSMFSIRTAFTWLPVSYLPAKWRRRNTIKTFFPFAFLSPCTKEVTIRTVRKAYHLHTLLLSSSCSFPSLSLLYCSSDSFPTLMQQYKTNPYTRNTIIPATINTVFIPFLLPSLFYQYWQKGHL